MINVKDLGAIGDGVNDDTNAFVNALSGIVATDKIYVPSGKYKITSTISLPQNRFITFDGDGFRTTFIEYYGTGAVFDYSRANNQVASIFDFNRLSLVNKGTLKGVGTRGIRSYGFSDQLSDNQLNASNCTFYGFEAAIETKWTGQSHFSKNFYYGNTYSHLMYRGSSFFYMNNLMSFDSTFVFAQDASADAFSNGITIDSCHAVTCASNAINIEGYQAVYISKSGCDLGFGGTSAMRFKNTQDIGITNGFISSNPAFAPSRHGIILDGSHTFNITGNTIVNNNIGIYINPPVGKSPNGLISGNKFDGQSIADIALYGDTEAVKITGNHFAKQLSRVNSNREISMAPAVKNCVIRDNTFVGTNGAIIGGGVNAIADNFYGCK
jgi:hypothetical protein